MDIYIENYDAARWQDDFVKNNSNGEQPGDPVKLPRLIYEVSNTEKPPLHLPAGADAVDCVEGYYATQILHDVDAWREKSSGIDFAN